MKHILLLSILISLSVMNISAQKRCGDHLVRNHIVKTLGPEARPFDYSYFLKKHQKYNRNVKYRIPVVFHIVYNTEPENITDDLVLEQLQILNDNFNRQNEDAVNTRPIFEDLAMSSEIEFYLADKDPNGDNTTGIIRKKTDKTTWLNIADPFTLLLQLIECEFDIQCLLENFLDENKILGDLDKVKQGDEGGSQVWDPCKYLNIWVCNMELAPGTPFLLGYAYPPIGAPLFEEFELPEGFQDHDGVVIHYQAFAKNNPYSGTIEATAGEGKTLVHEVGHYFGLRHIWGDGDCEMDDGLLDTPPSSSPSNGDGVTVPSCTELHIKNSCDSDDLPDMIENFMDYSPELCMNMFTTNQVDMMRAMIEGPRSCLIEEINTSVKDLSFQQIDIYPNPASGIINMESLDFSEVEHIKIYAINGGAIYELPPAQIIDISVFSRGLYIIEVSMKDGNKNVGKVVKI